MLDTLEPLAQQDDRLLLTEIYQRDYQRMMAVAMQILASHSKAEDAVHETFLKILTHMDSLKAVPEERRIYWVLTVTKNTALDQLRKEGREMPMEHAPESAAPQEEGGAPASGGADPRHAGELPPDLGTAFSGGVEPRGHRQRAEHERGRRQDPAVPGTADADPTHERGGVHLWLSRLTSC